MFEKMLGLVRDEVATVVGDMGSIPQEKQGAVVDTATSSLMNGLKQYANPGALGSLLGIGGAAKGVAEGAAEGGANIPGGLSSGVVGDLTSKAGLTPSAAKSVAGNVVPAVMSLFRKHVNDPAQPGFNLGSMIGALKGATCC